MVEVRGLAKRFGRVEVLRDVSLAVRRGRVTAIVGPNGAGKTTLIKAVLGLTRADSGTVAVDGRDVARGDSTYRADVGYMPQIARFPENLSAADLIAMLRDLRGAGAAGATPASADELVERFALGAQLAKPLRTLSGGTRQKVNAVLAFLFDPALLVLDEPTAGLDPLVQREFLGLIRDARGDGRTVFLSSHNLYEVESVADMVGILRRGTLAAVESVEKLKAQAVRRMDLTFVHAPPPEVLRAAPGVRQAVFAGPIAHLVVEGQTAELLRTAAPYGIEQVVTHEPDLEEVFLGYYQHRE
jgi:ABC-2 type transport system ATP-binding protein